MRLKPWVLTAGFGVLFAAIANLAWLTAMGTTGPWYSGAVSLQAYSVSLVVASLLALALVVTASNRAAVLDFRMLRTDGRIALLRATPVAGNPSRAHPDPVDNFDLGTDLDEEFAEMRIGGAAAMVGIEKEGHDALLEVPDLVESVPNDRRTDVLRELVRERVALREARVALWRMVAGPVLMSLVFVAAAGAMIPGSEGFAASHYQLNTTFMLFLGYGIAPLVAWAVIALGSLGADPRRSVA